MDAWEPCLSAFITLPRSIANPHVFLFEKSLKSTQDSTKHNVPVVFCSKLVVHNDCLPLIGHSCQSTKCYSLFTIRKPHCHGQRGFLSVNRLYNNTRISFMASRHHQREAAWLHDGETLPSPVRPRVSDQGRQSYMFTLGQFHSPCSYSVRERPRFWTECVYM